MTKKPKRTVSLSEWMNRKGVSDRGMARLAGVSHAAVERGRNANLSPDAAKPSVESVVRFHLATNGRVNVFSFFSPEQLQAIQDDVRRAQEEKTP